ncbi:MAG: formate dehydrogenase accessory sulfurtransferase FdhD [Gemmatimonadetes bacterium]|nr:formate dehydrogenase accessory sulfurtransferase FdhD [Gemmatimonadota bacterium]
MRRRGADVTRTRDALAVEEPLEIRVAWRASDGSSRVEALAVTMRTPGDDFELVAGFLHSEGVVGEVADLAEMTYCRGGGDAQQYNVVEARLSAGVEFDVERLRRNFYTSSSCGVCGKASLDAVEARGCRTLSAGPSIDASLLPGLPDRLREAQAVFERTGGLHAAGLFDLSGEPLHVREDVGRHNAVDKTLGRAFLDRALPAAQSVLVVSGRASFELVQKAVVAGVPALVAVGAPSTLAVDLASRFNQTLVGFARDGGYNVYCGAERVE